MAWQHISPEGIMKGYKKRQISSVVDGSDHMVWNGSEEYGSVRSECEEDEYTDWEHDDSDSD